MKAFLSYKLICQSTLYINFLTQSKGINAFYFNSVGCNKSKLTDGEIKTFLPELQFNLTHQCAWHYYHGLIT